MKLHGPLAAERVAVRRCCNAGEGFRETHGLHGNMDKLYYAAVKWGHQALLTGIQKVYEKIRASVRFPANLCPACISGARYGVCYRALPSDACQMAHSATVCAGHHCTIGSIQMPHRLAIWAALRCSFRSATGFRSHNLLKPFIKTNYGPSGQQCIKEKSHNEAP
jgi:hypothetical protein